MKLVTFAFGAMAAALLLQGCDDTAPEKSAEQLLSSAIEKQEAGDFETALVEFKNVLQAHPGNAEARKRLGQIYLAFGQAKAAEQELQRAVNDGAELKSVLPDLAQALLHTGDAKGVLDRIAAPDETTDLSDPDQRELYGLRAQALLAVGETEQGVLLARRILDAGPGFEAEVALARSHTATGDHAAALAALDRALQQQPNEVLALWSKGTALAALGRYDEAVTTLQLAREQRWRPVEVSVELVKVALTQGNTELAWQVLDELAERHSDRSDVKYLLAGRALTEERYADARGIAEELIGRYPEFDDAGYLAAAANFKLGNLERSRQLLQSFITNNPAHRTARELLAQVFTELDRPEEARSILEPLADQPQLDTVAATAQDGTTPLDSLDLDEQDKRSQDVREILQHIRSGEFDQAMSKIDALEQSIPESVVPTQLRAIAFWSQDKRAEAIATLEKALEERPDAASFALNLARMQNAVGNTDEAIQTLETAMTASPDNTRLKVDAARLYAKQDNHARVRQLLEAALTSDPAAVDARIFLAQLHLQEGRAESALSVAEQGIADAQTVGKAALLDVVGQAQQQLGDNEKALAAYDRLIEATPEVPAGYQRAVELLAAAGRPEQALAYVEKARERLPSAREVELQAAQALMQHGKGDLAAELIATLEKSYPQDADVATMRGMHAAAVAHDAEAAVGAYRRALELEPTRERLMGLVNLLLSMRLPDLAASELNSWRQSHEPDVAVDSALAEIYQATGQQGEAHKVYLSLVERNPENSTYRNNLAWSLAEMGELDEAQRHAEAAAKLAPGNPNVLDTLGVILLRRNQSADALGVFEKAVQAAPERADIQVNYAEALLASGNRDKAQAILAGLSTQDMSPSMQERVTDLRKRTE